MRRTIKDKMMFIEALLRDPDVTPAGKVVGARLMIYFNTATGQCNPSYATLASECGLSRRAVLDAMASLERTGWFAVDRAGNVEGVRTPTNTFKPDWGRFDSANSAPGEGADNSLGGADIALGQCKIFTGEGANSAPGVSANSAPKHKKKIEHRNLEHRNLNTNARPSGSLTDHAPRTIDGPAEQSSCDDDCPTLPLAIIEPSRAVTRANARRSPSSVGLETFPEWYAQFPRKVSRGNAEKAYAKIIKSGEATPAELLAGAMRYAAAVAGTEPRYIKHPASWLNAKGWLDEPEPQSWRSDPPSRADSAIQGITDYLIRNGEL